VITVPGFHKILSDKNVLVEVIYWPKFPEGQGITGFGAIIPCIQTINVAPNVKLTPLTGSDFSTFYVMAGAAAAVIVAVIGFLIMKTRRQTVSG